MPMLHHDSGYNAPESTTAIIIGTAFLAAWTFAVALYLPDEQARADRKYAARLHAEHTQVCLNVGFTPASPEFGRCIGELIRLQVRHQELSAEHAAATSLL